MMNNIILCQLRAKMREQHLATLLITDSDPHLSEYPANAYRYRSIVSGFTGSAGTLLITENEAGLWTDSRYFIQAQQQLEGSEIKLFKEGIKDTPSITAYLSEKLQPNDCIGINGKCITASLIANMQESILQKQISFRDISWMTEVIPHPKFVPSTPYIYSIEYAGESTCSKIARTREALSSQNTTSLCISALDEIAWLLNIRGKDVHCNPVVYSFLYLDWESVHLFCYLEVLPNKMKMYLEENGVTIHHYGDVYTFLKRIEQQQILMDTHRNSFTIQQILSEKNTLIARESPIRFFKTIKNDTEIEGIHRAMVKDGIALMRFLMWLEKQMPYRDVTELSASKQLESFRAEQPQYMENSFETIAGYGANGAIVHYQPTPESDTKLQSKGFLLLDSGAQYLDGTTDITRTIALGELSQQEKEDYTLVLKGHIKLAGAIFPHGTTGTQLDILAREALWKKKKNFLHGTGHGVGHFLNVHEGPQAIRMGYNSQPLLPGMLTSNEPGIYIDNKYGIRIENLLLTIDEGTGMYGNYYAFETVTLCPIDTKGILIEQLNEEERNWLNAYHQRVYDTLSPYICKEEQEWLQNATKAI